MSFNAKTQTRGRPLNYLQSPAFLRLGLGLFLVGVSCVSAADTNGFAVRFTSGRSSDVMVLPNLWLYVESGKSATPFLSPGKFTAVFEGSIQGDLRADYLFKAEELSGALKLEVNNAVVLDTKQPGAMSGNVQIKKGPNAVRATFTSGAEGDSFLRVGWTEKGTNVNPVPNSVISHANTPELQKALTVYRGRELFLENRCANCHMEKFASPVPELAMDAPAFDGIGVRHHREWLVKWVLDPKSARASAHMPKLLHGPQGKEDAEALADYLSSLQKHAETGMLADPRRLEVKESQNTKAIAEITQRSGVEAKVRTDATETPADSNQQSKPIFERLHCAGCHNPPDNTENDPGKISLKHVAQKFSDGKLAEFLRMPEQHFAWIRMPNFKLADAEAKELADFLLMHADKREPPRRTDRKTNVERGRELVQKLGCLNCHRVAKEENKFSTLSLAKLAKEAKGCLAEKWDEKSNAPDFAFTANEREALLAFVQTDFASLSRHAPLEFATREARLLNCAACHGVVDLIPAFDVLGGKLKPEWAAAFIAGEPFKIRADRHPRGELWVEARMPSFRSRAKLLAEAMAMQQGYPPRTRAEEPIDEEAAKTGHKMTGMDGGFSCVNCHAVNDVPAVNVFDSEGINLGLTSARLLKPYFFRWLRNPLAVELGSKMPVYFEDGRSALTDYYDGDGEKQINALYQYIRKGDTMEKPSIGQ